MTDNLFMTQTAYAKHREKMTGRSCTRQYINKLVRKNTIPLHKGLINAAEADLILKNSEEPSASLKRRIMSEDVEADNPVSTSDDIAINSYQDHKSQDARYSAELKRLKAEALAGTLIDKSVAEDAIAEVFSALRNRMLNMGQIAPKLITLKTEREIQTTIEDHVNAVLADFCDNLGGIFEQGDNEG